MTLDNTARKTALRLLEKFGKPCVLKSFSPGVYNVATGTGSSTVTSHPIKAYLDQPNKAELGGGQVVSTDSVAVFAALGLAVEPTLNDIVEVDGRGRLVKMVSGIWSGELVALWRVGLAS